MKLRRSEVDYIAQQIAERLIGGNYIETADKETTAAHIADTISAELMLEDRLNDEVRQILEEHADEVQRGGVEYYRMFNLVKARLIRERNLIL